MQSFGVLSCRAANHDVLGVIYYAQVDCTTLLHPWWWNQDSKKLNKSNVHFHASASMCVSGGEKQSISNRHFLVVVPQPIWKKQASHSTWSTFLRIIWHFLAKCSLPFFSLFTVIMLQLNADDNRATRRKIQKLIQHMFREEHMDK